jgi:hypothetical protein
MRMLAARARFESRRKGFVQAGLLPCNITPGEVAVRQRSQGMIEDLHDPYVVFMSRKSDRTNAGVLLLNSIICGY